MPEPPSSLVFRRKPAPDVRRAPNSVFCPEKPANSSPLNSSPLVTACHRLSPLRHRSLFGCKSAQKRPQFRTCGPTARRGPGSRQPPRWSVSPPSLSSLTSPLRPAPFLVQKALKTLESEEFVFPCRTASGMPEPQVSLVFGRKQAPTTLLSFPLSARKTGEFQPAELSPFVTASSPLRHRAEKCAKAVPERTRFLASLSQ